MYITTRMVCLHKRGTVPSLNHVYRASLLVITLSHEGRDRSDENRSRVANPIYFKKARFCFLSDKPVSLPCQTRPVLPQLLPITTPRSISSGDGGLPCPIRQSFHKQCLALELQPVWRACHSCINPDVGIRAVELGHQTALKDRRILFSVGSRIVISSSQLLFTSMVACFQWHCQAGDA